MKKTIICPASFSAINLDRILDAKDSNDLYVHDDIDDADFDRRYANRTTFDVTVAEILARKDPRVEIFAYERDAPEHSDIAFVTEDMAMFFAGHIDPTTKTFIADSDTCFCDFEELTGRRVPIETFETVRFLIEVAA
jgi:hypothetical protein